MTRSPTSQSAPWHALSECIDLLYSGPWQIIQLRGDALSADCIDGDDVDLLVSRRSIDQLLVGAYQWVKEGRCHLRVNSRRSDKVELTLFSSDGLHRIIFDLWVNLWQLDEGKQCLTFFDCSAFFDKEGLSIQQLPMDLEACIYVQHLLAKRRVISNDNSLTKLNFYYDQCQLLGFESTSALLQVITNQKVIDKQTGMQSYQYIASRLSLLRKRKYQMMLSKFKTRFWEARLAAPRKTRLISIMGCDGAGKTTIAHALKERMPLITKVFTGKHLYRKSFVHKAAVIFVRPLLFQSRENFDEKLAPLVYLRACLGQRIQYFREKQGVTLIDRSIIDFIYLDRKTDQPKFSCFHFLANFWGKRIPTVHCLVSYDVVFKRKLEMTKEGHAKYNDDMYYYFTRRVPSDYLAFNNELSVTESVNALERIIPALSVRQ